jgi:hypothetical protein
MDLKLYNFNMAIKEKTHDNIHYYKKIFWDRADIRSMQAIEFKKYIENAKVKNKQNFDFILRRFIERGSLTEALYFFSLEDIKFALDNLTFWINVPAFRLDIWKLAIEDKLKKCVTHKN